MTIVLDEEALKSGVYNTSTRKPKSLFKVVREGFTGNLNAVPSVAITPGMDAKAAVALSKDLEYLSALFGLQDMLNFGESGQHSTDEVITEYNRLFVIQEDLEDRENAAKK